MGGSCIIDSTDPFSITCMSQWLFRLRKRHVLSRDVRDKGSYLLSLTIINWIHPPTSNSHHQHSYIFSRGSQTNKQNLHLPLESWLGGKNPNYQLLFSFQHFRRLPDFSGRHSEVVFEVQRFIESPKLARQVAQAKRGVLCKQSEPNELHVFIRNKFLFCFQGETL